MLRTNRPAGEIIRIQLLWAQRTAGISTPILENTSISLPQLQEEKWTVTLRHFLEISALKIRIKNLFPCELQCENDRYIMDIAATVSDLCNAAGTHITIEAQGCNTKAIIEDDKGWPHQIQPGPKHLQIWNTFLQTLCTSQSNKLEVPMGKWTKRSIRKTIGCKGFVNDTGTVVRLTDKGWVQSSVVQKRRYKEVMSEIHCDRPNNREIMIPVDIKTSTTEKIQLTWRDRKEKKPLTEIQNKTWDTYVATLDRWEKKLLCNINFACTNDEFVEIAQNETETITIVSDGGCIQEFGSYGWVVAHSNRIIVTGQGQAYGGPMSSHRAEAFGKLSWMVFIHRYMQFTHIKVKCGLESFCDNKSVIEQTKTMETMEECYKTMMPNYDVVNEIVMLPRALAWTGIAAATPVDDGAVFFPANVRCKSRFVNSNVFDNISRSAVKLTEKAINSSYLRRRDVNSMIICSCVISLGAT
jgi:hypothetical protein